MWVWISSVILAAKLKVEILACLVSQSATSLVGGGVSGARPVSALELSDSFKSPLTFNEPTELSTRCLIFVWRRKNCYKASQNDGVELGFHHERGEQHRRSQCAHHALLLQTGGRSTAVRMRLSSLQMIRIDPLILSYFIELKSKIEVVLQGSCLKFQLLFVFLYQNNVWLNLLFVDVKVNGFHEWLILVY